MLVAGKATPRLSRDLGDYPEGIVIPVDKPFRWTSADVVRKVKYAAFRHFGSKKIKVGHAGTLDPLATGVLLVCIGKATKQAEALQRSDKEYVAGITFGATTPSYDLEKEIDRFYPVDGVSKEALQAVLPHFLGEQEQVAPLFSAKSAGGVRAYELARKRLRQALKDGLPFEDSEDLLTRQQIRIDALELLRFTPCHSEPAEESAVPCHSEPAEESAAPCHSEPAEESAATCHSEPAEESNPSSRINLTNNSALGLPRAEVRVACSKGTYIRALARDLGEALGSGAHLDSLCHTKTGGIAVEDALSLDEALALLNE